MRIFLCTVLIGAAACSVPDPHYINGDGASDDAPPADARYDAQPEPDAAMAAFVARYGGEGSERTQGLYAAPDGTFWAGLLQSDASVGSIPLTYGGSLDVAIAKLDGTGEPVWAFATNGSGAERFGGAGVDGSGNLIVAGSFTGTVDLGGSPLNSAGSSDLFIAKFSGTDGGHVWSVRYGGTDEDQASGAFVDSSGDIYVVGYFSGTTNIGGSSLATAGLTDVFVAKYSGSNGAHVWSIRGGGTQNDEPKGVAVDGGRVLVGGRFRGTASFGGSSLTSAGQDDLFLAAYQASGGSHVWSSGYGGANNNSCRDIAAGSGSLYVTGEFTSPFSLGGTTLTTQGSADIYLAKYDGATGAHIWSKGYGDTGTEVPEALLLDGTNVVLTGSFTNELSFGGTTISSAGNDDVFVGTVTQTDGSYVDTWRTGGTANDEGTALATSPTGPVIGGGFQGTVYFGTTETTSSGMDDAFVYLR